MSRILVIDDDQFYNKVLATTLEKEGHKVFSVYDGREGWNLLESNPNIVDIVFLDQEMPCMDGISCLKNIKQHPDLKHLPVLMLSGIGNNALIKQGLEAGADQFLRKPINHDVLVAILDKTLKEYKFKNSLSNELSEMRHGLKLINEIRMDIRSLDDARETAPIISFVFPNPERVLNGIFELLVNGIEHGNLGVSYEEKSQLLKDGLWENEINRRLALPCNVKKVVQVHLCRSEHNLEMIVRDGGDGFEVEKYLEFDPKRAFDLHGRGIAMSRMQSFD